MLTVLGMFFRAQRVILISFVVLFAGVLLLLAVKPKKYQAHMSFLLRNERAEPLVGSDPQQNSIQLPDVTEENLNSEVELLTSSEVLRSVVLNCHLANKSTPAAIESATTRLSKALTVTPVRNSSLIEVAYDSTGQLKAHDVLTELAKVYLVKRANLHTATQAAVFFDKQTRQAEGDLKGVEQERAEFLNSRGYENLPQQIQLSLEYAQSLQSQLDGAETQLEEAQGRLREIAIDRVSTPERVPTQQRIASNPYAQQELTSTLVKLENQRAELLTKFNSQDRLVKQTDQEIQNTQSALSGFGTMKPQENVSDVNPAWQALDAETNRLQETKMGLQRRAERLQSQLSAVQQRLSQMESDSVRVENLEQRVKDATTRFDLYEGKRVAAKIADDLDAEHISNVVIAAEPTTPAIPKASPLNLITGFLLALVGSLTIGYMKELLSPKMYGPSTVEAETGVPVIALVPQKVRTVGNV